jgi:hypothetical protein
VVHHQIHRHQRLDLLGVLAQALAVLRMAARSASSGTPVKSCSTTRDTTNGISSLRAAFGRPLGQLLHMLCRDLAPIAVAQHRFEHDANRHGQPWDLRKLLGQRRQRIELAFFAL